MNAPLKYCWSASQVLRSRVSIEMDKDPSAERLGDLRGGTARRTIASFRQDTIHDLQMLVPGLRQAPRTSSGIDNRVQCYQCKVDILLLARQCCERSHPA